MRRKESGIGKHKTTFIFQQIIHMTCMTIIKDGNQPSYDEPFIDREMRITLFLEITISAQQIFGFCKAVFLIMSSPPPDDNVLPPLPRGRAPKINGKCGRILRPLAFFTTAAIKNPPPKGVIFAILP